MRAAYCCIPWNMQHVYLCPRGDDVHYMGNANPFWGMNMSTPKTSILVATTIYNMWAMKKKETLPHPTTASLIWIPTKRRFHNHHHGLIKQPPYIAYTIAFFFYIPPVFCFLGGRLLLTKISNKEIQLGQGHVKVIGLNSSSNETNGQNGCRAEKPGADWRPHKTFCVKEMSWPRKMVKSGQVVKFCPRLFVKHWWLGLSTSTQKSALRMQNANLDLRFSLLSLSHPFSPRHPSTFHFTSHPPSRNKHPEMGSQSVNVHTAHWDGLKH